MNEKEIKYFSMFTGVGGFELGLRNKICGQIGQEGFSSDKQQRDSTKCTSEKRHTQSFGFKLGLENSSSGKQEPFRNRSEWTDIQRQRNCSDDSSRGAESKQESGYRIQQWSCVGFSETDKYASELLSQKFPNTKNYGDATKINPEELPNFDMLCGGFPCQAFSIAGKRKGFSDTRGTLFFDIARIVKIKRPKTLLLENVKGLLNHDEGKTFRTIIQTLSELGYDIQWMVLNSKFFGVPQNRERVFIIGSLTGTSRPEILPLGESNSRNTESESDDNISRTISARFSKGVGNTESRMIDVLINASQGQRIKSIKGLASSLQGQAGGQGGKTGLYMIARPAQLVNKNRAEKPYDPNNREMKIKIRDDETSYTVKSAAHEFMVAVHNMQPRSPNRPSLKYSSGGSGHLQREDTSYCIDGGNTNAVEFNNMKIRRLTPTECERLQGFPDGWTEGFSDTQRYKMMGNAVTVNVVKAIAEKLLANDKHSSPSSQGATN